MCCKQVDVSPSAQPFAAFAAARAGWRTADRYRCPGPIQYSGTTAGARNFTLAATDPAVDIGKIVSGLTQELPSGVVRDTYGDSETTGTTPVCCAHDVAKCESLTGV